MEIRPAQWKVLRAEKCVEDLKSINRAINSTGKSEATHLMLPSLHVSSAFCCI